MDRQTNGREKRLLRGSPKKGSRTRRARMAIKHNGKETPALDEWIDEITVDASGEDEQLWAFRQDL
jgi:hypothetical protein